MQSSPELEIYYENHYRCFDCGETWCDDVEDMLDASTCPNCDASTAPHETVETTTTVTVKVIKHAVEAS